MSPLETLIRREIAESGPMTVARYMGLCLGHPDLGYYMRQDPLGAAGDFTTAPEISQMFGEMIGIWTAEVARSMPGTPRLVELGPGRGTLMRDVRRVLDRLGWQPETWLVETSPSLRAKQADAVPDAHCTSRLGDVPDGPFILIANEFFDALPVHQFLETPGGWRERQIGVIRDRLDWGLSGRLPIDPDSTGWHEHSPAAQAVSAEIAARLGAAPGAALIVDYGYTGADRPAGPTLQAVAKHQRVDALHAPGDADLTWLVDFDDLQATLAAQGAHTQVTTQVTTQGNFLAAMGIGARAASLAAGAPDRADEIAGQLDRLTAADQMGSLFKVAAALSGSVSAPPGFGES